MSFRNILIVVVAAAACGHKAPETTNTAKVEAPPPDPGSGSQTAPAEPPKETPPPEPMDTAKDKPKEPEVDAFLKLSLEEKKKIMKNDVMPAMAKAFKAHDAKKFGKFNCKSCHGKGAADETFKMPNPDLPPLDFAAIQAGKQEPKMVEFMEKTVKPDMAKMLKLTQFDPAHPEAGGFGCLACHVMKK